MPWRGEGGLEALDDEGFAGAVGFGDEIDVALVLGGDALFVEAAEQGSGLAGDAFGDVGEFELLHNVAHPLLPVYLRPSLPTAARGRMRALVRFNRESIAGLWKSI